MAIEIVDLPVKIGDFQVCHVCLPEGKWESHLQTGKLMEIVHAVHAHV